MASAEQHAGGDEPDADELVLAPVHRGAQLEPRGLAHATRCDRLRRDRLRDPWPRSSSPSRSTTLDRCRTTRGAASATDERAGRPACPASCSFDPRWPSRSRYQGGARRIADLFRRRTGQPGRPPAPCRRADDHLQLPAFGRGDAPRCTAPSRRRRPRRRTGRSTRSAGRAAPGSRTVSGSNVSAEAANVWPCAGSAGRDVSCAVEVQPVLRQRRVVQGDEHVDQRRRGVDLEVLLRSAELGLDGGDGGSDVVDQRRRVDRRPQCPAPTPTPSPASLDAVEPTIRSSTRRTEPPAPAAPPAPATARRTTPPSRRGRSSAGAWCAR